jgi:hypothetical protein
MVTGTFSSLIWIWAQAAGSSIFYDHLGAFAPARAKGYTLPRSGLGRAASAMGVVLEWESLRARFAPDKSTSGGADDQQC